MDLKEFDYFLPQELIAQEPLKERDKARLLVLSKKKGEIKERKFDEIVNFFKQGDCLVLNNAKVIPARIFVYKESGAKIEILIIEQKGEYEAEAFLKPAKRVKVGMRLYLEENVYAQVLDHNNSKGKWHLRFYPYSVSEIMATYGKMPVPPYIKKELTCNNDYQTVYAKEEGAIASPTAGLHFTEQLLKEIEEKGVRIVYITLYVGVGTFKPIKVSNIRQHNMEKETYSISSEAAKIINETRQKKYRVWVVGTTVVRALESTVKREGDVYFIDAGRKETQLFIYPPYDFKIVDVMITNFHLPKSTNFVLVSAFAGLDLIKKAYHYAIANRYRFYSFGDAMLIGDLF